MASIHIYHEAAPAIRDALLAKRPDLEVVTWTTLEEFHAGIGEARIVFAGHPPREGWAGARNLELVQMMGAGVDLLLPTPDLPPSVRVAGVRGIFAAEASEHAIAMMLALVRGLPTLVLRQQKREWKSFAVDRLAGKTLVVVGLGEIGRRIATIASAMEMNVLGVSNGGRRVEHVRDVAMPSSMTTVLGSADVLVVCVPRTPQTVDLIDAGALAAVPERSLLVSLGRGGIVNEPALLAALQHGHIGGAALDVFENEPLPPDSPWWTAPNTIITPHLAGGGLGYTERCIDVLLDNVDRLERGEPLANLVDRARGY